MKKFKLSENIDPNKVFIINRSELEGRLDINFNSFSIRKIVERIKSKGALKLIDITEPIKNGSTPSDGKFENSGVTYYRSQDFTLYSFSKNQYISEIFNSKIIRSYIKKGDILLAVVGATLGKVGYVYSEELEGNINQNIARIRINDERFLSEFVAIYLDSNIGQKLIQRYATITTQAYLNNQQLGKIPIPLLKIEVQQNIINILKSAYLKKQQKEAEAQRLLDSIDDYLLGELGITLPKEEELLPQNTDKNNSYNLDNDNPLVKKGRLFLTNLSEVTGKRIDPDYNSKYFYCLFQSLNNSIYPFERIKKYLKAIKTGTTPNQKLNAFTTEKGIPFLRNTNLKKYEINIENTKYIRTKYKDFLTFSYKDEVIMCIAGTIGISSVNIYDIPISINQNVSSLRFSEEINPFFISYWFNTNIFLSLAKRASSLATILYLNNDNLKSLPIPIPPLQKQNEIATHISQIRNKANTLKQEGKEILEQAKQEVEQMILEN